MDSFEFLIARDRGEPGFPAARLQTGLVVFRNNAKFQCVPHMTNPLPRPLMPRLRRAPYLVGQESGPNASGIGIRSCLWTNLAMWPTKATVKGEDYIQGLSSDPPGGLSLPLAWLRHPDHLSSHSVDLRRSVWPRPRSD